MIGDDRGRHAQPAMRRFACPRQHRLGIVDVVKDAAHPLVEQLALLGQSDPPRAALQEPHPELLFEPGDTLADSGSGNAKRPSSGDETAEFGGTGKGHEAAETIHHVNPFERFSPI